MTPHQRRFPSREDALLFGCATLLGLVGASLFAAYRAVSADGEEAAGRLSEFAMSALWPGVLIFAGICAAVIFGWKANLD
jgi:hypothetical protein